MAWIEIEGLLTSFQRMSPSGASVIRYAVRTYVRMPPNIMTFAHFRGVGLWRWSRAGVTAITSEA